MGEFFPSTKARLIIRFDFLQAKTDLLPPPTTIPLHRVGTGKGRDLIIASAQQKLDHEYVVVDVVPKRASHTRTRRQGETLSLDLKYIDFPIDPRTIRSCAVKYYAGTVTRDDFVAGLAGATRPVDEQVRNFNEPLHRVPDEFVGPAGEPRSNLRFEGFVDRFSLKLDDGMPLVTLDCSGNVRLLIDQEAPPNLVVGSDKPVDQAIADYLGEFPQFDVFDVRYVPGKNDAIQTAPSMVGVIEPLANKKKKKSGQTKAQTGAHKHGHGQSVWDYLVEIVFTLGLIIRVDGHTIIIQSPVTQFDDAARGRDDDPFKQTTRQNGTTTLQRRTMIFGRNLMEAELDRNFSRQKPRNIEVRSYIAAEKRTNVARWPPVVEQQATSGQSGPAAPGDDSLVDVSPTGQTDTPFLVFPVMAGIVGNQELLNTAKFIYQLFGRTELTANFKTRDLASFGGDNDDPDLLDVMPIDAMDVFIEAQDNDGVEDGGTDIKKIQERLKNDAKQFLESVGYTDAEFQDKYAAAYSNIGIVSTFLVSRITSDWDGDSDDGGLTVSAELVNYVLVDRDKTSAASPVELAAPSQQAAGDEVDQIKQALAEQDAKMAAALK